ncbi:MAG: sulfotransferase [Bacteroidetes bacterium]|nr:sulfotransferase [Bacteroidota bacterium]
MAHTFDTEAKNPLQKWWWKTQAMQGLFYQKDFKEVEQLLLFIGYPRSGHTLIGSMLDAHPDMLIAHELDALYYYREGFSNTQLYYRILQNSIRFTRMGREWEGYHYRVPNQWQGKYRKLRVIGDKCGGRTSHRLKLAGDDKLLYQAHAQSGNQMKLLHVIRNPFDNVSTMVRRTAARKGAKIAQPLLKRQMRFYFDRCRIIDKIRQDEIIPVLDIHLDAFIRQPESGLEEILDFIGLKAEGNYIKDCASIVWDNPNQSRKKVEAIWTPEMISLMEEKMAPYSFLEKYHFESA